MTKTTILAAALAALPLTAMAMPGLGDMVGTNPTEATAALKTAGCDVKSFEAEDGKIEAKCIETASGKMMEVYIDPVSGKVARIKDQD